MQRQCTSNRSRRLAMVVFVAVVMLGCLVLEEIPEPDGEPADECNGADAIPEFIDDDFTANDDCDVVEHVVVVRDARLSVQPGTTLEFADGAGIHVEDGGALYARGQRDAPITFSGVNGERGAWKGIYLEGTMSRDNVLEDVVVEYAGESVWDGRQAVGPATIGVVDSRLDLENASVRSGGGHGLVLMGESELRVRGDNEITDHHDTPVRSQPNLVGMLTGETSYRNNDSDFIVVTGGVVDDDTVWNRFDVPIRITGPVSVAAHLRIAAGNELVFDEDAGLEVVGDGNVDMEGEAEDVVVQ